MLTAADDYPIHQLPTPIAVAGTDRNFYDRFFFNGYAPDGSLFFAAAMGVYPHLNVIDAAFCVTDGVTQRSVFASRILNFDRMDTQVGPIAVKIEHPLHRIRLVVGPNDSGLEGDLVFSGRVAPIEEPRFTRMQGARTLMDLTRMTQNGDWTGSLTADGRRHDVAGWQGTRDRSWGVRPIGAPDAQPVVPLAAPQFYWLWAPLNFPNHAVFFHTNDDGDGTPWNRSAVIVDLASGAHTKLASPAAHMTFKPQTRHASKCRLEGQMPGGKVTIDLDVERTFFMHGIGYGHPTRAHGTFHGPLSIHSETITPSPADEASMGSNHIQALVSATMTLPDGTRHEGRGILEQLIFGPHAPSGFKDLFDLAG